MNVSYVVSLIYRILINSKTELRSHLLKLIKFKRNGNQVLVHTSNETIFGTDSKNCTYKSLAYRYFKAFPFKQHRNCVSFMKTPSCAYISMHDCTHNVNYMEFKD